MASKDFKFKEKFPEISSTTYLTHGLHSYTAKFIPHIPRFFIEKYTKKGDIVMDPFAGSGTTLLESNILGRNALGVDINPLAVLISKVKITPIKRKVLDKSIKELFSDLDKNLKPFYNVEFPNKNYWFSKESIYELNQIMSSIERLYKEKRIKKNVRDLFVVCFSSIIRKSSFADPSNPKTYCSPRMRKLRKENHKFQPIKYFKDAAIKHSDNSADLYDFLDKNKDIKSEFISTNNSLDIKLPKWTKKVDLIVTSPPYANAQEYFRNFKLELFWLKMADNNELLELEKNQIGGENHAALNYKNLQKTGYKNIDRIIKKLFSVNKKSSYIVYKYFFNMEKSIREYRSVLKKGRHCVIIIGNNTVRGVKIPIYKTLIEIAENNGFKLCDLGYDKIQNRKFMTKRNNGAEIIVKDWVIDLIKI